LKVLRTFNVAEILHFKALGGTAAALPSARRRPRADDFRG
jgi:hypothetical protein